MNADYGEPQAPRKETKRICTLTSMRSIATNRHINTDRDMCTIIVCVCIYTIILYMQEANIKYCATNANDKNHPLCFHLDRWFLYRPSVPGHLEDSDYPFVSRT